MMYRIFILLALFFEALAIYLLLQPPFSAQFGAVLFMHIAAATSMARGWYIWRKRSRDGAIVAFILALTIPVFALPGLILMMVAFVRTGVKEVNYLAQVRLPELPHRPRYLGRKIDFSQGSLLDLLHNSRSADDRISAVLAIQHIDHVDAINALKLALKDPVDEVRLLAYSILDRKESEIDRRIQMLNTLDSSSPGRASELAWSYWESLSLGLLQGDMAHFAAAKIQECCDQALAEGFDLNLLLLQGRLAIWQGQPEDAEHYFSEAVVQGLPEQEVLKELIEVDFLRRSFSYIPAKVSKLKTAQLSGHEADAAAVWQPEECI